MLVLLLLGLLGLVWNLVVLSCMAELKVPVSRKVEIFFYIPWGISLVSVGIMLYFVLQMLTVSVTGRGVVLLFDRERAARRVARALGYSVKDRQANAVLLCRIKEMSEKKE